MEDGTTYDTTILKDTYDFIGRFVKFPDEHTRVAWTLWVAHTHIMPALYASPRLHVMSATSRSGKSVLRKITKLSVHKGRSLLNPSPPSLFRAINELHKTNLIEEVDNLFARKEISDITSIINDGFDRSDAEVSRVNMKKGGKIEYFNVFGPLGLFGIDKNNIPDAIENRCIQIRLKRRYGSEKVERFRPRRHAAQCLALQERLQKWGESVLELAKTMDDPQFPPNIEDRQADKWESVFIVADVASTMQCAIPECSSVVPVVHVTGEKGGGRNGQNWANLARSVALSLQKDEQDAEASDPAELRIPALDKVFKEAFPPKDRHLMSALAEKLTGIPDSPFVMNEHGRPFESRDLGKLLKRHGIKAVDIRIDKDTTGKGFYVSMFDDVRKRYVLETLDYRETSTKWQAEKRQIPLSLGF